MNRIRVHPRLLAALIGLLAAGYIVLGFTWAQDRSQGASAWTAGGFFGLVSAGSADAWYNYDFKTQSAEASNVDWPIRYLFAADAEVDKVKNTIDGCGGDPTINPCLGDHVVHEAKFRGRENGYWYWDGDGGRKQGLSCQLDQHIRVYALSSTDRNWDPELGYYILGSVHKDYEGGECDDLFYSAEGEQGWWDTRIAGISGWTVHANISYWSNFENARWADSTHWVHSDGLTTYVDVP